MTPRQARLCDAAEACRNAARAVEMDSPISELDDPMTAPGRRELITIRQRDVVSLKLAANTALAVAADPDAFGMLMDLRSKKPKEFDAIMVLVRIELERPAPAEQARAA